MTQYDGLANKANFHLFIFILNIGLLNIHYNRFLPTRPEFEQILCTC